MINNILPLLEYFKKGMSGESTEECINDHFLKQDGWEAVIDDGRKAFNFYVRCSVCDEKFYHIYMWKESW
jgi:hypothetical protein